MIAAENLSISDRILIAAEKLDFEKFVKFQERECSRYGALVEIKVMLKVSERLGLRKLNIDFSKYNEFLLEVWCTAQNQKSLQTKSV